MISKKKYSKEYKDVRAMFWDGKDNNDKTKQYRLDREGIIYALGRALRDYTSRTNEKQSDDNVASVENMTCALTKGTRKSQNSFVERLVSYFDEEPIISDADFDAWHHDMCNLFSDSIKEANIRAIVPYGKAQKIVNMAMKNIYCLEGAETKNANNYFKYCHMPLDSIILEWFRRSVARDWFNETKDDRTPLKISTEEGPLPKWSNLEFKDCSLPLSFEEYKNKDHQILNGKYHYMFFVRVIREYFNRSNAKNRYDGLTPLEAEFYIWQETQLELAAEALYSLDIGKEQAIQDALKCWGLCWTEQEKGNPDKQFKRCIREFKKRSLEEKVTFLQTRVTELCKYVDISETISI
jgi:hypothetical protein